MTILKHLSLSFAVLLSLSPLAYGQEGETTLTIPQGLSLDWGSEFGARHLGRAYESSQLVGFETFLRIDYKMNDHLGFHAQPGVSFITGRTEWFYSEDEAKNSLRLKEAYVSFKPIEPIHLYAGALNQSAQFSSIFVGSRAFPGAHLGLKLSDTEYTEVELAVERTIPTSSTFSAESGASEDLPFLDSIRLIGEVQATPFLRLEAHGSLYKYSNLPGEVASESEVYGNSIDRFTSDYGDFRYGFAGIDTGLKVTWDTTVRLRSELVYLNTTNQEAPRNLGNSYSTGIKESYRWNPNLVTGAGLSYYKIAPDSTVAYYGGGLLGKTNRQGYGFHFSMTFPETQVQFTTDFFTSQALFEDEYQEEEQQIVFGLEMFNELI